MGGENYLLCDLMLPTRADLITVLITFSEAVADASSHASGA
jgi:hypothetical protein